ncbi:MAG: hypothetical protein RIQ56_683 [Candidatus Parcubacteria bacterium]|jgi:hypothetical protein
MDPREAKKRLLAAQTLLLEPSTTIDKFRSLRTLLYGIHPNIDEVLHVCDAQASQLQKVFEGDFLTLGLEKLPENSEEEKRRKQMLILFWNSWNKLKGEVARVQAEFDAAQHSSDAVSKGSAIGRILNFAKGPFGIFTAIAVGVVVLAQTTSIQVEVHNKGCATMNPSSALPISLPGLSFPKDPISNGGSAIAVLPAFAYTVDGTAEGRLSVSSLTFAMNFELGSVNDVLLDGQTLLGKVTTLPFGGERSHKLEFICL